MLFSEFFINSYSYFLNFSQVFFNQEILPTIMQTFALALIAITIPIAILLTEKQQTFEFDRFVILSKVIKGKTFLLSLMLLFLPLFFWDVWETSGKISLFALFIAGVVTHLEIPFRSYKWIQDLEVSSKRTAKGYRMKKRFEYLSKEKDQTKKLIGWEILAKTKKTSIEEYEYIKEFINAANDLFRNNINNYLEDYLSVMEFFIEELNVYNWCAVEKLTNALLDWDLILFEKWNSYSKTEKRNIVMPRNHNKRLLSAVIKKVMVSDVSVSWNIFHLLENFTKQIGKDYKTDFIDNIAYTIFNESPEEPSLWKSFPENWKVTKENLENNETITQTWLDNYLKWSSERLIKGYSNTYSYDSRLDLITRELFPEVDPITWSTILTFKLSPHSTNKKERLKDLIENRQIFGHIGRTLIFTESSNIIDSKFREQEENAIELALRIFKNNFTKDKVKNYIRIMEEICREIQNKSRCNRILSLFRKIEEYLQKKKSDNPGQIHY